MKRITLAAFAVFITACFTRSAAQTEEEMKAWMEYMTPGNFHKEMAKWDGEWDEEMTMWMSPESSPQKYKMSCVNKMIMGGRFQTSTHTGSISGMQFEGISTTGYDNAKQMFVSTWIDNMGTGIMVMEGAWDEKNKTLHLKGKQTDPATGKDLMIREAFTIIDDNTQKIEMFQTPSGGQEFKSMEILFTRKK